jgi:hypothetical protein
MNTGRYNTPNIWDCDNSLYMQIPFRFFSQPVEANDKVFVEIELI